MLKRLLPFFFLTFSLLPPAVDSASSVLLDKVVAVVNNEAITWTELYRAMEFEMSTRVRGLTEEEKRTIFRENETAFLESMIETRLQLQEAEKLGIAVTPEEVDRAIETIGARYSLDPEAFRAAVRQEGFTMEKYREMIHDQITIGRLVDREVRGKIKLSEDEINEGLRKENLEDEMLYGLSQIFFRMQEGEGMESLQDRIHEVMDGIAKGLDFEELAAMYSEGPAAKQGGQLGLIPKSQLAAEFLTALSTMKPGDVSPPFRTRQGVHILKLTSRKDAADAVREKLFEKEYRKWVKELRAKSFIELRLD